MKRDRTTFIVIILVLVLSFASIVFLRYKIKKSRIGKPFGSVSGTEAKSYSISGKVTAVESGQIKINAPIVFVGEGGVSYVKNIEKILLTDGLESAVEFEDRTKKIELKDIKIGSEIIVITTDNIYTLDTLRATQVFFK